MKFHIGIKVERDHEGDARRKAEHARKTKERMTRAKKKQRRAVERLADSYGFPIKGSPEHKEREAEATRERIADQQKRMKDRDYINTNGRLKSDRESSQRQTPTGKQREGTSPGKGDTHAH